MRRFTKHALDWCCSGERGMLLDHHRSLVLHRLCLHFFVGELARRGHDVGIGHGGMHETLRSVLVRIHCVSARHVGLGIVVVKELLLLTIHSGA